MYREAGAQGIGVWEFKLPEGRGQGVGREAPGHRADRNDLHSRDAVDLPGALPGPQDPKERTRGALRARSSASRAFEPEVILCLTGHPGDTPAAEARKTVVDGLRRRRASPASTGSRLGLEPLHREVYGTWTMVTTIPETIDLMDEVGEPNVGVLFDVYHLWDTDNVLEDIRRTRAPVRSRPSTSATGARRPGTTSTGRCRATGSSICRRSSARSRTAVSSAGSTSRSSRTTVVLRSWTSRTRSGSRMPSTSAVVARRAS